MKPEHQVLQIIREQTEGNLHGIFLAETTSTNGQIMQLARAGELSKPTVLITNNQTTGRGTRDRHWLQAANKDIAFSIAIPFEGADLRDPRISLTIGAMLANCLEANLPPHSPNVVISHKWPNDILLGKPPLKCGGILIETTNGWMVVGIGLNLNSLPADFPDEISGKLTTIRENLGLELDRDELVCKLVLGIAQRLGVTATQTRNCIEIAKWVNEWRSRDATGGKQYLLQRGGVAIPVIAVGVDIQSGGLLCKDETGNTFTVTSYTELDEI